MSDLQKTPKLNSNDPDRDSIKGLGELLYRHLQPDTSQTTGLQKSVAKVPVIEKMLLLSFLKPIPWVLLAIFSFSFYWDFQGVVTTIFGLTLNFEGILKIISVSGMIGFLTNWIAITMLFRPLKKRPLLGQGLIPAHKERIAYRLAFAVSEDLINPDLINQKIKDSKAIQKYRKLTLAHLKRVTTTLEFRKDLKDWLMNYLRSIVQKPEFRKSISEQLLLEIENSLKDKVLEKAALKTYTFFRGQSLNEFIEDLLQNLPVTAERNLNFLDEYLDDLPRKISANSDQIDEMILQVLNRLVNQLNVQKLVEENLRKYDEKKLENMIRNATNEQLKTIQYLGAVLGTIGGFVIWEPVLSLILLSTLFGTIYLIDRMLFE
tara:strand:+ start:62798 stop:63925 length:1128 start_codon:yes stop_codon:yes gene_type:complete